MIGARDVLEDDRLQTCDLHTDPRDDLWLHLEIDEARFLVEAQYPVIDLDRALGSQL
jgi:hypothetical protein